MFAESAESVIKVPFGEWGEYCNDNEALESAACTDGTLARCVAFKHSTTGVCLLRMERVVRFPQKEKLPDWVGWIDSGQVGYVRDGRLVAYDWVCPPPGASGFRIE